MKMLCNMEVRETAGIQIDNTYVFACTQKSQSHITGWHALNNVCDEAGIKEKTTLTATKNRHRVSTLYAALDLPDAEQALLFKHMGHSANINQNIYQVPLAIREVTQVGMQLQRIDKGKLNNLYMNVGVCDRQLICVLLKWIESFLCSEKSSESLFFLNSLLWDILINENYFQIDFSQSVWKFQHLSFTELTQQQPLLR